jgi:hypothetical protein
LNTQVFVAKYVADPARWEPRNVGVIVMLDGRPSCRFLGEKAGGEIDGRSIRHAVGAPVDVYREWVRYWRRSVLVEGRDPGSLETPSEATFFVQKAGEAWVSEGAKREIDDLVSEYFRRLVSDEEPPGVAELKVAVERLLADTGVAALAHFKRDVVVESSGRFGQHRERFRFAYGYNNGHRLVGHRVPLGIESLVHDALYRYLNLPEEVHAVSFVHGWAGERKVSAAAANLAEASTVVDVAATGAASEMGRLFGSG